MTAEPITPKHNEEELDEKGGTNKGRTDETLTNNGTSLLIINCTTPLKLALFEKLTRYLSENVRFTCEFSSMRTAFSGRSSSSSESSPDFLDFFWEAFLAFFAGLLAAYKVVQGNKEERGMVSERW